MVNNVKERKISLPIGLMFQALLTQLYTSPAHAPQESKF